jgi:hypothetical protein
MLALLCFAQDSVRSPSLKTFDSTGDRLRYLCVNNWPNRRGETSPSIVEKS